MDNDDRITVYLRQRGHFCQEQCNIVLDSTGLGHVECRGTITSRQRRRWDHKQGRALAKARTILAAMRGADSS